MSASGKVQMKFAWMPAVIGLCLAVPAFAQSREERPIWNRPTAPFRILGNVHYVGTQALGAYLIATPKGHILIDGAMPESADQIAGSIRRLGFRLGEARYVAALRKGRLDVKRREIGDLDVLFIATPAQLAAVIYGGAPLDTIRVDGDLKLAKRFVTFFPLPPKAA